MKEKIDFVVTWVDGGDREWQEEKAKYLKAFLAEHPNINRFSYDQSRYRDFGTLKYWFRGVEKFASWVNKVYFVTNGQVPEWLNLDNDKLVLVKHEDFMPKSDLQTFSSEAIEVNLQRIKGLSENFVYFNDDLFIIKKTKPTDFFKNNLPREMAALSVVLLNGLVHADINDAIVLNKHFDKNEVMRHNFSKWFNPIYGKALLNTFFALPYNRFVGMYEPHLCNSLKKSTFERLWKLEPQVFALTSKNRFRSENNVNLWLLKNFQICEGNFVPRSLAFGKNYIMGSHSELFRTIRRQKYKIVCINDSSDLSETEFEELRDELIRSFEEILPEKSSFEK